MNIWQSIIMGIIEGLTEFLPISSTAHLILTGELLRIEPSEFLKTYNISIQLGAIFAVIFLYWKKVLNSKDLILKILTALIPTIIIGFIFYNIVKAYLMESLFLIAITLFVGGIIILLFEKGYKKKEDLDLIKKEDDLSYKQAFIIGIFQTLARIPGVSRSAATIVTGLWLGLKRKNIVEFSFLLAIPTMIGASFLDLIKNKELILNLSQENLFSWIIGFSLSFITAIIGVKFLLRFIQKNNFIIFAWYRIALGLVIGLFLLIS